MLPLYGYKVVNSYPHDTAAFTEGLVLHKGLLYESTGREGQSWIGIRTIANPRYQKTIRIDAQYFGEGITIFEGKLYQLTWKSQKGFIRDPSTLKELDSFTYRGQGWGLTHDDTHLIMSDGTATIRFLEPNEPGTTIRTIRVTKEGRAVTQINEMEWVKGEIYANVWRTQHILRINPNNGVVTGVIDLTGILPGQPGVLNGIAYDSNSDRLLVTGKLWTTLFEIDLVRKEPMD